jgi:hypothetical protein
MWLILVSYMRDIGGKTKELEKDIKSSRMEIYTEESSWSINLMEREFTLG